MYGWNDFSFKNVLGAAYNQVRFIVRNLRYMNSLRDFYSGEILAFYHFWGEKLGVIFVQ